MVKLEAYVDDSASEVGDKRLFLAGYINGAAQWAAFSEAWRAELARPPAITYLKMAEAQNLRGEFRGWPPEARDAKVLSLARLIPAFRCWSAHTSVSRKDYSTTLKPASPAPLKAPYFTCWWALIDLVARYHISLGYLSVPPVDFTFDQQEGASDDAALWFQWLQADHVDLADHLRATLVFRDDKSVPPLQAADMLAWHLRRRHERGDGERREAFDLLVGDGLHVFRDIEAPVLMQPAKGMRAIPGIDLIQTKAQWKEARRAPRAAIAAGQPPPSTNLVDLHILNLRVRVHHLIGAAHHVLGKLKNRTAGRR